MKIGSIKMDIKCLHLLPMDVLEHICLFLGTVDIIKLAEFLPEFDSVSCRKQVVKNVNLFEEYYITRKHISFFTVTPRCDFITSLNLNCLYWVPAADIRKCIISLQNLEQLYILDTKLGLLKQDLVVYNKILKLRKLGLSVTRRTFCKDSLNFFPKLTHFYLHLDVTAAYFIVQDIMFVLRQHECLEEFWLIENTTLSSVPVPTLSIRIPSSVVKFNSLLHNIYFGNGEGMQRIHRNSFSRMLACWEKRERRVKSLRDLEFSAEWNTFCALTITHYPFTPKQTEEILNQESLNNIKFDEIHFAHNFTVCGESYKAVVDKLILGDNMQSLKKLALNFCACICDDHVDEIPFDGKRRKRDNFCLLNCISENSPNIQELEIWSCVRVDGCNKISNNSCNAIANFKYLRKLTLDNLPIHISGSFLNNVFASCKHLSSLRIKSKQQNSSLHNFLCISLKHAVALKDLRYEHPCNVSVDRLLLALSQNENINMERVFIKCKSVEIFSAKTIQTFLESSNNLRFFYIVIADLPKTVIKQTMKLTEKYVCDPRKILIITNNEFPGSGRIQIPFIHVYYMISYLTHVAGLDVFNGYIPKS